ncbi:MAG: c-type cytochrome [Pseudomonadota bacterium]
MRWFVLLLLALTGTPVGAAEFTTLKGHGGPVMAIAALPDGRVVTGSFDNSVGMWSGRVPSWLEGHDAAVVALAATTDGKVISGGDDFTLRLWPDGAVLGRHEGKVAALAVRPGQSAVASGGWDGAIHLWSLTGAAGLRLPDPGAGVNALHFAPDGAALYAGTSDGRLLRYDMAGGAPVPVIRHGFGINTLVGDAGWLAYGTVDGSTRIVDPSGAEIADFTLDRRPILSMAYHAGSGLLAVGDGDGFIMLLDSSDWSLVSDLRAMRQGPVWALSFSPDGETLYAAGLESIVYAWPVDTLDRVDPVAAAPDFLRAPETMPNGERQFTRKCSICHALNPGPSRKAGPTLHGVFGRRAGTVEGYPYSPILESSEIVWSETTIDALFDAGPDHYIPGSKMPMQVIAAEKDRMDLIAFLKRATREGG